MYSVILNWWRLTQSWSYPTNIAWYSIREGIAKPNPAYWNATRVVNGVTSTSLLSVSNCWSAPSSSTASILTGIGNSLNMARFAGVTVASPFAVGSQTFPSTSTNWDGCDPPLIWILARPFSSLKCSNSNKALGCVRHSLRLDSEVRMTPWFELSHTPLLWSIPIENSLSTGSPCDFSITLSAWVALSKYARPRSVVIQVPFSTTLKLNACCASECSGNDTVCTIPCWI